MDEDDGMECSPMDPVFSWMGGSRREGKCSSSTKRKYQEDSGYITTPCSSQSASGLSWALGTPDDGFNESPSEETAAACWNPCDCRKEWEDWERGGPLLPTSPEAPVPIPAISPTQPKILRSRDLPRSSLSFSSKFSSVSLTPPCRLPPSSQQVHSQTDLIYRFTVLSSMPYVLSQIFSYLSDSDITSMTMVSKTWYDAITCNKETRQRWLNCVATRKSSKENLNSVERSGWVRSPLKSRNHSTPLRSTVLPPSSPPVSPSKLKFHLYVKEAAKLKEDECLMHCPACDLPSRCMPVEKRGKCSRVGCALEFCMNCRSPYHGASPCVLLSPPGDRTPQKRISRAQSRRNLRRLLQ